MDIKTLSTEEIQSLQTDAALRLIGEYTQLLTSLNTDISNTIIDLYKQKSKYQSLLNDKRTLIELIRSLKIIVSNS